MLKFCMDMKVYNQNNVSFKSRSIQMINIRNAKTNEPIPVLFSRLNPNDLQDINVINKIYQSWDSFMGKTICGHFLRNTAPHNYWAIELLGNKSLSKKIIGLVETDRDTSYNLFDLRYLVVKPSFSKKREHRRVIKDIGEVMFAEVINLAKKENADYLKFVSICNEFYKNTLKNAKINPATCHLTKIESVFFIRNNYFDKYLKYISNKYKFDFSA